MTSRAETIAPAAQRVDRRGMSVVSAGHALTDTCQGAVPALLPFLIAEYGWTYAAVSALVLAGSLSSSVVQPAFGLWADQRSMAWLMPLGIFTAGLGIGLAAVADGYWLTFFAVLISGLGVAAFHPEGSRYANYLSGDRRARGMSYFSLGGNAGFALGPLLVTPLVAVFGLPGALFLVLPTSLVALLLVRELPRLERFRPVPGNAGAPGAGGVGAERDDWPSFRRLGVVIVARTFVYFGLLTFVPLYYAGVLGTSNAEGNVALVVMLVGGATGTLVGGQLADRVGRRPVLLGSLGLLPPLVLAFVAAPPLIATPLLFVIGMSVVATFSVTVVMGQEYLPSRIGLASGVTLGLAIGLGGVGAPALGLVADAEGLETTMLVVAAIPLIGLAFALTLPRERRERPADAAGGDRAAVPGRAAAQPGTSLASASGTDNRR